MLSIPPPPEGAPVRFAILTANPREQNVVRYFLKLGAGAVCDIAKQCTWDQDALLSELVSIESLPKTRNYDLFKLTDKRNPQKMVAGVHMKLPEMGAATVGAATDTTLHLLDQADEQKWSLEVILAVGCCGVSLEDKTKGDSLCGTVLLSSKLEDYLVKGKAGDTGFELHPQFYQLNPEWSSYLSEIAITRPLSSSGVFQNIPVENVHKIESGAMVIKDTDFGNKIRAGISIVGLEMEGSGIARALSYSRKRSQVPDLAVVKAVSDCGGEDKNQPGKTSFFGTDHEDVSDDTRQEVATFHAIALVMRCVAVKLLNCDICPS